MSAPNQNLVALPYRVTKVVHLVRHGKGYHNDLPHQSMYTSWDYYDAHLTPLGWAQAQAVHAHVKANDLQVELVVASPLTRTLETAAGAFGTPGTEEPTNGDSGSLLMHGVTHEGGRRAARGPILKPRVPVVAHEGCRETLGVHPCDKRRSMTEIAAQFPGVDFSAIETDEDTWWKADVRETAEEMQTRGREFAKWLMLRPEKHIAVVSHSGFLFSFFQNFGHGYHPAVAFQLHRHFNNCEMRTILLSDVSETLAGASDPLAFLGGDAVPDPEKQEEADMVLTN